MLGKDVRRDQLDRQENVQWDDDNVVEVSEDGHEIRNEVDRRKSIAGSDERDRLCIPHTPVPGGEIEGVNILFDPSRQRQSRCLRETLLSRLLYLREAFVLKRTAQNRDF